MTHAFASRDIFRIETQPIVPALRRRRVGARRSASRVVQPARTRVTFHTATAGSVSVELHETPAAIERAFHGLDGPVV